MKNTKHKADIEIDISCNHSDWENEGAGLFSVVKDCCIKAIQKTSINENTDSIEVSILLTSDEFIKELNTNYRSKEKPTNVLSFPSNEFQAGNYEDIEDYIVLGDIILALETIKCEAAEQNKEFMDHLRHLVIHGTLHLLGYDHIEENQAEAMESLEISLLTEMGIENPYS